jgi:hypothetical protein
MHYEPVAGPGAWTGRDLARRDDWIHVFTEAQIAELQEALTRVRVPLGELTPAAFPLPTLGPFLRRVLAELLEGRGFVLLRGLPVERWSREEQAIAYLGLGAWLGRVRSQNAKGHLLGHVKDLGLDIRNPNVRYYQTNRALEYHTDSVDVVGLLCLQTAKAGGASYLASSMTVFNEILRRRPQLIPTRAQVEVMDLIDELCNDPEIHLAMDFRPGDVQLLHNHQILHARGDFENWPEPERHRHLLRLWLAPAEARPLPDVFAPRYGSVIPGERGGIVVKGTTPRVPLEAE